MMLLAKGAGAEGKTEVAEVFDSIANECWGKVNEAAYDLENAPRNKMLRDFAGEHPDVFDLMVAQLNSTD